MIEFVGRESMTPVVSVLICVRNMDQYISDCLTSVLNQSFTDLEIVIVDDASCDDTKKIIEEFDDKRIRTDRNHELTGLSQSRNQCLKYAKCEYVFFTDADCVVSRKWIEEGLKYLKVRDSVGVEGKTFYVSEDYKPAHSDSVMENRSGGQFMTCNIAYKKHVLKEIGGFDERFFYMEDRDLALRAIKHGKIIFNPGMVIFHAEKVFSRKQFVQSARRVRNRVF